VVSNLIALLIVAAFVVVAVGALLLLLVRRHYQARITALKGRLQDSPEFIDDRSYNQLKIAKAEAAALARQGVDIAMANNAIADAESAGRRRDYESAYRSAQLAHELLVHARTRAAPGATVVPRSPSMSDPTGPSTLPTTSNASAAPAPFRADAGANAGDPAPPAPRLAKNRAESRFQIGLLQGEVDRAATSRPEDAVVEEGRQAVLAAQAAYDQADYTGALRLALRGRRKLGAEIESLPAPTTRIPPTPAAPTTVGPAGTAPCATCGRPLKASDRFCRGCGAARTPTACPSCGTPVESGDKFCPGCGATVG
jgi:hypothetical protein